MSDFDTRRVGEIAVLEEKIQALQSQVAQYRAAADKWEPKVGGELMPAEEKAKVSLHFGGKNFSAVVPYAFLQQMDAAGASTMVVEALFNGLVKDALRSVIQPEVERLQASAKSLLKVGKW